MRRQRVLGAATITAALVMSACGGDGDSAETTTSSAVTTSTTGTTVSTTTTTEAPVGQGGLLVTYNAETCEFSGPDSFTLADQVTLTFLNDSPDVVFALLKHIPPDRLDELQPLVGTDFDYREDAEFQPTVVVQARPGEEATTSGFLALEGTYVVDCTLFEDGFRIHSWWPAALEVTR